MSLETQRTDRWRRQSEEAETGMKWPQAKEAGSH